MRMRKVIISIFLAIFAVALAVLFVMKGKTVPKLEQPNAVTETHEVKDSVHTYKAERLTAECQAEDRIFCAIEQVVKCTISPELKSCTKDVVPGFVLGKIEDTPRPTEISFEITKIKPVAGNNNISVYTKSDCNAVWFGLCKGTVIYSLTQKNDGWEVTNIYALEQ